MLTGPRRFELTMRRGENLSAISNVAIADIDPLPTVWGPSLLPTIVPVVRCVVVKERSTNERKIAEMTVVREEKRRLWNLTNETPTGEGCADKAISTGDKHAQAGDHASAETTAS